MPAPDRSGHSSIARVAATLLASAVVAATAACSGGAQDPGVSEAPRPAASAPTTTVRDPVPSGVGPSAVVPANAVLADPMKDLAGKHGNGVGAKALLSERGRATGTYTLQGSASADAFVTVTCAGPGRYTVTGDGEVIIGSVCKGSGGADIRLPLRDIGTTIAVSAPGPFWLVVAPATA